MGGVQTQAWGGVQAQGGCPGPGLGGCPGPGRVPRPRPGGMSRPRRCVSNHALRQTPPPPADGYCCGRYASYWNAFLCLNFGYIAGYEIGFVLKYQMNKTTIIQKYLQHCQIYLLISQKKLYLFDFFLLFFFLKLFCEGSDCKEKNVSICNMLLNIIANKSLEKVYFSLRSSMGVLSQLPPPQQKKSCW